MWTLKQTGNDAARGFQWFAIVRQASSFLVAILLTKSTLSISDIGIYESWMILGSLFSLLALTGIYQTFLNQYRELSEEERPSSIFSFYLLSWIITLVLSLAIYGFSLLSKKFLFDLNENPGFILVLLFLLFHLNAGFIPYLFLARDKKEFYLPYSIFYVCGSVISVLPALITGDRYLLLIGLLIWSIVEQILTLYFVLEYGSIQFQMKRMKIIIRSITPISVYMSGGLLAQFFDAWLVNWYYQSMDTLAIFRYGARELPGSLALASAFTSAMLVYPREKLPERIKRGSLIFMHLFFPVSIILFFYSSDLFVLFYNQDFKSGSIIFNTYLLLVVSRWIFPQVFLMSQKYNSDLIWISVSELMVNVVFSVIFLKILGLTGIALGTVVAYMYEKLVMILVVRKRFFIEPQEYIPVKWFLFYTAILIFIYIFIWNRS